MDQDILKRMIACDGGSRRKSVQWRLTTYLCLERCLNTDVKESTITVRPAYTCDEFQTFVLFRSKSALGSFEVRAVMSATYLPSTASVSNVCRPSAAIVFNILVLLSSRRFKLIRKIWAFRWQDKKKVYLSKTNNPLTKLIVFAYSLTFFSLLWVSLFMLTEKNA